MSWDWLVLLVFIGLATFRLTRLVVRDDFPPIRKTRELVIGEDGTKHEGRWYEFFGELVSCHWCASGWVSLSLVLIIALGTDRHAALVDWFLLWIAAWAIGSVTADKVG